MQVRPTRRLGKDLACAGLGMPSTTDGAGEPLNAIDQSARMPRSLITLPHLTRSDAITPLSCSGELPTVSTPMLKCRSFTSGRFAHECVTHGSLIPNDVRLPYPVRLALRQYAL